MIDRSEVSGFGLAVIGHVVLFGILSVSFLTKSDPVTLKPQPMEVSLVGDVGLESQAPEVSTEMPAPAAGENAPEPEPAPPAPEPDPAPAPRPDPATRPAEKAKPQPTRTATAPPTTNTRQRPDRAARPGLVLDDSAFTGPAAEKTDGKSDRPPASAIGANVKSSLAAEILRQIKPHWKPPSGADSDRLRTTVEVRLAEDGSIVGDPKVTQQGVTESNRAQAQLHRDRAVRAVRLAAPFKLPDQFYNAWKLIAPTLYEDL